MLNRRHVMALGAASCLGAMAGGCSRSTDVTAGSKNFQEQWILAELMAALLRRRAGVSVRTKDFAGTMLSHKALTSGGIDCYVEYTGTALTAVLDLPTSNDVAAIYRQVKSEYAQRFKLLWLPPLGFENTFAILIRRADAKKQGLKTISDLARVANAFRPGFGFEFYDRPDGYRGLVKTYGISFAKQPKQMKLGLTYRALDSGDVDVIAGNSTDGLIAKLDLVMLDDDRHFFPPYQAAPVLRLETAKKYPKVRSTLESLAGKISADAMRRANFAVDGEKKPPKQAAAELLATLDVG